MNNIIEWVYNVVYIIAAFGIASTYYNGLMLLVKMQLIFGIFWVPFCLLCSVTVFFIVLSFFYRNLK
jgi:hypothetical protein